MELLLQMVMNSSNNLEPPVSQSRKSSRSRDTPQLLRWFIGETDRLFKNLAGIIVFMGSIAALTIAVSLVRVSIARLMGIVIILGALVIAGLYRYSLSSGQLRRKVEKSDHRYGGYIIWGILIAAACFFLLLWLTAYALPDTGFDGLWYHNPTMHFWALKGYVHWIDCEILPWKNLINDRFNGWPKGVELLGFVMTRAAGVPRLLNALNLPLLALGVYSIICLSRLFGAWPGFSLLAGVLFLFVPVNIVLSFTTLVDPGVASCYIALMAMTAFTISRITRGIIPWKLSPALGCAMGLSIAAKGPGIILLPLVSIMILLSCSSLNRWRQKARNCQSPKMRSFRRFPETFFSKGLLFILIAVIITVGCGGYWHLRNLLITGSPVYPVGLTIGGRTIFPGKALEIFHQRKPYSPGTEEWTQLKRILFSWLDNLQGWRRALTLSDPNSGGMGLLWILGCVPSILILGGAIFYRNIFSRDRKKDGGGIALPFLSVVLITLTLFFFMPAHHNHKVRYVLWLYGLGLPSFAVVAGWARFNSSKLFSRVGMIWMGLCVILIVFEGLFTFYHQVDRPAGWRAEKDRDGSVVSGFFKACFEDYPAGYFWKSLKGSAFENIFNDRQPTALGPLYVMRHPILGHLAQEEDFGERRIYFLDEQIAGNPDLLRDFINKRNIRYVIWEEGMLAPQALNRMAIFQEKVNQFLRIFVFNPASEEMIRE